MKLIPRAFHVQVVEPLPLSDALETPAPVKPAVDFARLAVVSKHLVQDLAKAGVAVYASKKTIDVVTDIALIAAKAKFK